MRLYVDTKKLHIGKESTRRTLCDKSLKFLEPAEFIDVNYVANLVDPHPQRPERFTKSHDFCASCYRRFYDLASRSASKSRAQYLFFQDDVVLVHSEGLPSIRAIYRGPLNGMAVVYNPISGAQFTVPYCDLEFTE